MVAKPNNYNIAITCDFCGKPVYFGEDYWVFNDGKQMCVDCLRKYMEYVMMKVME